MITVGLSDDDLKRIYDVATIRHKKAQAHLAKDKGLPGDSFVTHLYGATGQLGASLGLNRKWLSEDNIYNGPDTEQVEGVVVKTIRSPDSGLYMRLKDGLKNLPRVLAYIHGRNVDLIGWFMWADKKDEWIRNSHNWYVPAWVVPQDIVAQNNIEDLICRIGSSSSS